MSPEFDEEKIHKVRTTIKKMRAIGDWSGVPARKFFKKNYRMLGEIRNIQLLLSKINNGEYVVPAGFTNWLKNRLHLRKVEWQKKYDRGKIKNQLKKFEKRSGKVNLPKNKHALKFEEGKTRRLIAFMNERPLSDQQIHNGRKMIKEIGYLDKWERKDLDGHWQKMSEETGNFMDRISSINLLDQYITEETGETNKNDAQSILAEWRNRKEEEKRNLMKIIDSMPAK